MEGEEFVLAIVAIAMGTGIIITAISKGVDLIKSWINRNNASYDEERFERLAKAFIQHKKNSDRRFQNLEAIITDDNPGQKSTSSNRTNSEKTQHHPIEIESDDAEDSSEESGHLQNMLNKKRTR